MIKKNDTIQLTRASYKILDWLGEGGQGIVWRAENLDNGQQVALKTVNIYENQNHTSVRRSQDINILIEYAREEIRAIKEFGTAATDHYIITLLDDGDYHYDCATQYSQTFKLPVMVTALYQHDLGRFSMAKSNASNDQPWSLELFF